MVSKCLKKFVGCLSTSMHKNYIRFTVCFVLGAKVPQNKTNCKKFLGCLSTSMQKIT
jgi:hypothetical protein